MYIHNYYNFSFENFEFGPVNIYKISTVKFYFIYIHNYTEVDVTLQKESILYAHLIVRHIIYFVYSQC